MCRRIHNRKQLLSAVDGFLDGSAESMARAHRIVVRCASSLRPFTIDDVIWGPIVSTLRDSLYYQNSAFLSELRAALTGSSSDMQRAYVCYDYRPLFSRDEREWFSMLLAVVTFLAEFPFLNMHVMHIHEATEEYLRQSEAIRALVRRMPVEETPGRETIYHLVLRQVTTIVVNVNLSVSLSRYRYLVPGGPYSSIYEGNEYPDISSTIAWADKALRSISGTEWLLITYQLVDGPTLSIH